MKIHFTAAVMLLCVLLLTTLPDFANGSPSSRQRVVRQLFGGFGFLGGHGHGGFGGHGGYGHGGYGHGGFGGYDSHYHDLIIDHGDHHHHVPLHCDRFHHCHVDG